MTIILRMIYNLKKAQWAGLLAFCLGAMLGTASCGRRPDYLEGNVISLIDRWNMSFIKESPFHYPNRKIDKERLDKGWRLLSVLDSGVMLWETRASMPIDGSREAPLLLQGSKSIVSQGVVSLADTPVARWSWLGNRVMLTTDKDPSREGYSLCFYQVPQLKRIIQKRVVLDNRDSLPLQVGLRFYPLDLPVVVERVGSRPRRVSVSRDGIKIPFESRLFQFLEADRRPSEQTQLIPPGWAYAEGSTLVLYRADQDNALSLLQTGDGFRERRFLPAGPAKFLIRARGGLAGAEQPRLAIYLDEVKFGEGSISRAKFHDYEVKGFIPKGWHTLRFVFENDFYDRKTGQDRNIFLSEIALQYQNGIILSSVSPVTSLTVDCPDLSLLNTPFKKPLILDFQVKNDIQRAIYGLPDTIMAFPLVVPPQACLSFSLGALPAENAQKNYPRVKVRIKPHGGRARDIFSTSTVPGSWQNHVIDLDAYSSLKAELIFEIMDDARSASRTPPLAIGNPLIFSKRAETQNPPVIIFMADSLRADHLRCYGYDRNTSPFIDAFARDAVLFVNATAQASWTLASIASFLTSLYPSFHGAEYENSRLSSDIETLPEMFKDRGYTTAAFVENEFLNPIRGLGRGFDRYHYEPGGKILDRRLSLAQDWISRAAPQGFLLFFHALEPHAPYRPPLQFAQALGVNVKQLTQKDAEAVFAWLEEVNSHGQILSPKERQGLMDAYDAEIRYLDNAFGRLVKWLKQQGLYDDSVMILTSDHGEEFQEHGYMMHGLSHYQEVLHVPLLIKFPDRYHLQGLKISPHVQMIDILPTVLEACGMRQPQGIQGKSLLPLCSAEDDHGFKERAIFSESRIAQSIVSIVQDDYKYIYSPGQKGEELFNLARDPQEKFNGVQAWPGIRDLFRQIWEEFRVQAKNFNKGRPSRERIVLGDKEIERLRALGYLR